MKKIAWLLIIVFVAALKGQAQEPSDSSTAGDSVQTPTKPGNPIVDTAHETSGQTTPADTAQFVAGIDKIVDSSTLHNAQAYPKKYLYSNYLFDKNYKEGIKWFHAILALIILLLLWIFGLKYAMKDGLCKDACFDENGKPIDPVNCPFSYARTQLFWWTMIILSCYVFFYGVTGVMLPLNITAALLLGFGAVVYGFGKIIDNRQIQASKGNRNQDKGAQNTPPEFIKDLLSDDNGVSIHRFQAALFNLIFGIGFVGFFIKALLIYKYPFADFNEWQFALLGISSTTYLGMKAAENNPDATSTSSTVPDEEAVG